LICWPCPVTVGGVSGRLWWHNTRGEVWLWRMNGVTLVSASYVGTVPDTDHWGELGAC